MSSKKGDDDEGGGRHWEERANSLDQVRKKLRSGWRNDDAVLNQYFQSCFTNWKVYKGKRTPQQVLKLQAIYKQAIHGDNTEPPPARADSAEGLKWIAWQRLTGTPKDMAKRRFITFLAEIDPVLIDVMPDEKPPIGFPLDRKGIPVCAKCNTKVGCLRPLLDQNKNNLKQQLFEHEELHDPKKFREWVRNALANQRCIWGVHKSISRAEAKPFMAWFDKDENRGFYPYDSISVMLLIHELIHHHHEVAWDMMMNQDEVDPQDYNLQAIKTIKLKEVYEELSGEEFIFYLPCERDNDLCVQRRLADGGRNHTHPAEIDPPTASNVNTMEEAVELRIQCQKLGINPCTGVVVDIAQRCEIYRSRIEQHFEALQKAAVAKLRNEKRTAVHAVEKAKVKELSKNMLAKQCWDVCQMNMIDSVLQIVHRGCNPNEESPRGFTPLITLVINDAQIEKVEELLALKANINAVNRFGLNPLMLACRLNNSKMVHILMRSGASALQKDEIVGRTCLHWCVVHGCEELVKIIVEYLKDGAGDSMRVTRFLDSQTLDGETPLMLAARLRNGPMCYTLTSIGANPNMRNNKGRTAAYLARQHNWSEIADWLEKKVGAGMSKVETFSDLQFDKQNRFGLIKIKDLIHNFGRTYLLLMQNRVGLHPLGCPFVAKEVVQERGEKAITEQRRFIDNHQLLILKRDPEEYSSGKKAVQAEEHENKSIHEMREHVNQMLALLRTGTTNPNAELEPKPLAWTPLMCAVAMSDIRTIKLMIREGANPNHPNRDGTTPVMLAAQLHNVEALTELLLNKGDLEALDSQGFSVFSYATSLPLPTVMSRNAVGVLMDGDTDGPRPMTSMDLIKLVMAGGLKDIKEIMTEREAAASPEALDAHYKVLSLLEKYGLSAVHTERNVQDQVRTAAWRVKEPTIFQHKVDEEAAALEKERQNKILYQRLKRKAAEDEAKSHDEEINIADLRCPVCTLQVPCAHFFKVEVLKQFLEKKAEAARRAAAGEAAEAADALSSGTRRVRKKFVSARKLRIANRVQEILEEAHIADRNTDRSTLLMQQFRGREIEVFEEKQRRDMMLLEAQRLAEEEEALRDAEGDDGEGEFDGEEQVSLLDGAVGVKPVPMIEPTESVGFESESEPEGPLAMETVVPEPTNVPSAALEESPRPLSTESQAPIMSKVRASKRLPSKQELSGVEEPSRPSATASEAPLNAEVEAVQAARDSGPVAEVSAPITERESSDSEGMQLVVLPPADGDTANAETSQALVPVESAEAGESTERSLALVPVLKSALKLVLAEDTSNTAMVEFKKKRRVKFYFAGDQEMEAENPVLAITNGPEDGVLAKESPGDFSNLSISDDSSISSDSTGSSTADLPTSLLITSQPALPAAVKAVPAGSGGIAMTTRADAGAGSDYFFDDIEIVSTTTTLTSAEGASDPPIVAAATAGDDNVATVDPEPDSDAMSTFKNGALPDYMKASTLVNPVPLHNRRVFMFTKNTLDRKGRTDGLVHVPPAEAGSASTALISSASKAAATKKPPKPPTASKGVKGSAKGPLRIVRSEPLKVQVSGWIFVSLADIQSEVNPLNSVTISLESWGGMLESVRMKLFDEWMSEVRLEPVVSSRTWQPGAPRCSVCSVGFVRFRSTISTFQENPLGYIKQHGALSISSVEAHTSHVHLCLACAVRKELFLQSKIYFPASATSAGGGADQQVAWPFMHRKNIKAATLPKATFSFLSGPTAVSSVEAIVPMVPTEADAVAGVAVIGEAAFGAQDNLTTPLGAIIPRHLEMGSTDSVSAMSLQTGLSSDNIYDQSALALLPPTSLQTAQSNSPVKSSRLQELDAMEVWEKTHNPGYAMQLFDQESDMSSIQSNGSMFSSVTESVNANNKDLDAATISVASTVTAVNVNKKPKELALLPFLVAKGHYEEAERTLRIALGKRAVDEGEGLKILISLLTLQAEMYKSMGIWPLALAIYFDCVDLNASVVGYNDPATLASVVLLVACLRKMQCVHLAGKYIKALCKMVETECMKSMRAEIVEKIKKQDSAQVKEFLGHNAVWTEQLKPLVVARNPLQRRFQSVVGMGGFYSLLTAQDGYSVVARVSFYRFCEDIDAKTLGVFARYVDFCFRLRLCDEPQMYKYLIQHVTQKQLAKSLVSESEVARLYRVVTTKNHIDLVIDFLNYGVQPTVAVFDALLKIAIEKLFKVYRIFLLFDPAGSILREQQVEVIAEAYDVSALIIQTAMRRKLARLHVGVVRAAHVEEEKRLAAIALSKKKRAARF